MFANNIVLVADSAENLNRLLPEFRDGLREEKIENNVRKSKGRRWRTTEGQEPLQVNLN